MHAPLSPDLVRFRLRAILLHGTVTYAIPHAIERLRQRKLTMIDCENVLRGGSVDPGEWENGAWRYRVRTNKLTVVAQFLNDDEVLIVTAWRNE